MGRTLEEAERYEAGGEEARSFEPRAKKTAADLDALDLEAPEAVKRTTDGD
jgi:hypothetical protein